MGFSVYTAGVSLDSFPVFIPLHPISILKLFVQFYKYLGFVQMFDVAFTICRA